MTYRVLFVPRLRALVLGLALSASSLAWSQSPTLAETVVTATRGGLLFCIRGKDAGYLKADMLHPGITNRPKKMPVAPKKPVAPAVP